MLTAKNIPIAECHDTQCTCNVTLAGGSTGSEIMWRTIGRPVVLVTTSISLFLEVSKAHVKKVVK